MNLKSVLDLVRRAHQNVLEDAPPGVVSWMDGECLCVVRPEGRAKPRGRLFVECSSATDPRTSSSVQGEAERSDREQLQKDFSTKGIDGPETTPLLRGFVP